MKVNDLKVADVGYAVENNVSDEIANLLFHQKYLLLNINEELYSLEIMDVGSSAFYLRIVDDEEILKRIIAKEELEV